MARAGAKERTKMAGANVADPYTNRQHSAPLGKGSSRLYGPIFSLLLMLCLCAVKKVILEVSGKAAVDYFLFICGASLLATSPLSTSLT